MKRGEVWWADLGKPRGSEPRYRRPVLVIQSNPFNQSRIATIVVAAITSNITLVEAPGNVRISKSESGLEKPSVVNVSQIVILDKAALLNKVKQLPSAVMAQVDQGLALVLGLQI